MAERQILRDAIRSVASTALGHGDGGGVWDLGLGQVAVAGVVEHTLPVP